MRDQLEEAQDLVSSMTTFIVIMFIVLIVAITYINIASTVNYPIGAKVTTTTEYDHGNHGIEFTGHIVLQERYGFIIPSYTYIVENEDGERKEFYPSQIMVIDHGS